MKLTLSVITQQRAGLLVAGQHGVSQKSKALALSNDIKVYSLMASNKLTLDDAKCTSLTFNLEL